MRSKFVPAIHVAVSLLKVRRLFYSLFLGPVLLGLFIVLGQAVATILLVELSNEDSTQYGERINSSTESEILRGYVFGSGVIPSRPQICTAESADSSCTLKNYDIVVHNIAQAPIDFNEFEETFRGAAQRIHFCKDCKSDFILTIGESSTETMIYSLSGLAVLFLADNRRLTELRHHLKEARTEKEKADKVQGNIMFKPPGMDYPLVFSKAQNMLAIILNVCLTVAIILWLAIRAHRRVLDYFAKNDVLLPLVAGCGKRTVYDALWLLSLGRVLIFVLASLIPLAYVLSCVEGFSFTSTKSGQGYLLLLWIVAVLLSLGCFGTIVSIAELRQRYPLSSLLYKAIPITLCFLGLVIWVVAILNGGDGWNFVSNLISILPIVGLTTTLVAPLSVINPSILIIHVVLCLFLASFCLSRNSNWFATHLEEI